MIWGGVKAREVTAHDLARNMQYSAFAVDVSEQRLTTEAFACKWGTHTANAYDDYVAANRRLKEIGVALLTGAYLTPATGDVNE